MIIIASKSNSEAWGAKCYISNDSKVMSVVRKFQEQKLLFLSMYMGAYRGCKNSAENIRLQRVSKIYNIFKKSIKV